MTTLDLHINHQYQSLGVESFPSFSWKILSDMSDVTQWARQILIRKEASVVYNSGKASSDASQYVLCDFSMEPFTRYEVDVTVWLTGKCDGIETSEFARITGSFETGRLQTEWESNWITGGAAVDDDSTVPPYLFRKSVQVKDSPVQARLFASALGLYHITVDGLEIAEDYYEPGYTQCTKRIPYKEYDVTALFTAGEHTLRAELAGGWYAGRLGLTSRRNLYGDKRALCAELRLFYEDGRVETLGTDDSWQVTTDGPRRFAEFFDGEIYDASRRDESLFDWQPASIYHGSIPALVPYDGTPVRLHNRKTPIRVHTAPNGSVLCDFGTNFAGVVALEGLYIPDERDILIRHGEILSADGSLYTGNLRSAKAEIRFHGQAGVHHYRPRFTYMGFRYAEISGLTEEEVRSSIAAYEVYADMPVIGSFSCSDERLNQLYRNILTSQKANFVEIPTDCPQRDERCGWTGDIALFVPTAALQMDISLFMRKWLRDCCLAQTEKGVIPDIVPNGNINSLRKDGPYGFILKIGSAVWGDVITIAPWTMYWATGDETFLRENYAAMKAWVDYCKRKAGFCSVGDNRYIWSFGFQFGDWLAPGEDMGKSMAKSKWIATAYFAHSVDLLARSAAVLGFVDDAARYGALFSRIRAAFRKKFLDGEGHIKNGFQTIYALALRFDLLNEQEQEMAAEDLCRDIAAHGGHLATGFPGTPHLTFALSDHGKEKEAFDLMLQDTAPSWLYPVRCGATSIWERWDALREDGTVNESKMGDSNMVSFNHYAYGAVGDWMVRRIIGLEATKPGYRQIRIHPVLDQRITSARLTYDAPYGLISVQWEQKDGQFDLAVTVPANTSALICLPDGTQQETGSGKHRFTCRLSSSSTLVPGLSIYSSSR